MMWLTALLPGLLLGIALQRIGLADTRTVRRVFALRAPGTRALPSALGFGMMLCALLCWLAVIDIDLLPVLPLDGSVVLGGVIAGISLGLTGCTPGTCLAALGGGRFLPALCGVLGVVSGVVVYLLVGDLLSFADTLLPASSATLFRVTLTQPFAVDGRFLGLGCLGLFIVAVTLLFPHRSSAVSIVRSAPAVPKATPSSEPSAVQDDAFISLLPEEEPLVVDTAAATVDASADTATTADEAPADTPPDDSHEDASNPPIPTDSETPATPILDNPDTPPDSSPDNPEHQEEETMHDIIPADPVTPGMTPAPASADPETGVSPVPVVLPARKVHKRKPTGTRKQKE